MQAKKLPPLVCPSPSTGTELFPASTELTEIPVIHFITSGARQKYGQFDENAMHMLK